MDNMIIDESTYMVLSDRIKMSLELLNRNVDKPEFDIFFDLSVRLLDIRTAYFNGEISRRFYS